MPADDDAPIPFAKDVKEPTVSRAAPTGRKFPCPACGARLDFNPAAGELACPYCGFQQEIEPSESGEVVERDYKDFVEKLASASQIRSIADHAQETKCSGCGAMVILEDHVAADQCPFCHTFLQGESRPVEGLVEPESLLPFAVDLRGARERFSKWLEGLWFAPSGLVKIANLGQLTGVYVPYWTYDSMTYTRYVGDRGDNYTDTETVMVRDASGAMRSESRPVTRIAWTTVSGEVQHFFDDVLVCGSQSLPDQLVSGLEPWKLGDLLSFQSSYLSGFRTEHYAVGLQDGFQHAKDLMRPIITDLVRRDIGGDHQRISDQRSKFRDITFKHTLLPVWIAVYRYQEKVYQILVNGSTGKVVGKRPWSVWKITRLVLAILLAILLFAVVFGAFSKKGPRRHSFRAVPPICARSNPQPAVSKTIPRSATTAVAGVQA